MIKTLVRIGIALTSAAVLMPALPADATSPDTVRTTEGSVRGIVTATQRTFYNLPYAAPPVGELRWRAPRSPEPWQGIRDATRQGAMCPQAGFFPDDPPVVGSEDCLYLNVDTPRAPGKPRPVLVFVHGGGFIGGAGAPYDPGRIVAKDVVTVTVNYRMGALGFLDHPAMSDPAAGNFGIADQQAALRWIRRNIDAFGGDPGNVTLWGESAGAYSVCAQLASPGAKGLFHKAISQSGPCGNDLLTRKTAETRALKTATDLGCSTLACLKAKPFQELTGLYQDQTEIVHRHIAELPWFPVAGTVVIPRQPLEALRAGAAAGVPLLHGGTKDEMRAFVGQQYVLPGKLITAQQYPQVVTDLFGARTARRILKEYPAAEYPTPTLAYATLLGDYGGMVGACSQLPANRAAGRWAPLYSYEFAEPGQPWGDYPVGATHGGDVPYFFDSRWPGREGPSNLTPAQKVLADRLVDDWTRFARTGSTGWPAYTTISLSTTRIGPVDVGAEHHCSFWRTVR